MGMDLIAKREGVESFGRSWWTWRGLWEYAEDISPLDERNGGKGQTNDGRLGVRDAKKVADALDAAIAGGGAAAYIAARDKELDGMADVKCESCHGTGRRTDMNVPGGCNGCGGKGKRRPYETYYRFDLDDVRELATFLRRSGGFEFR